MPGRSWKRSALIFSESDRGARRIREGAQSGCWPDDRDPAEPEARRMPFDSPLTIEDWRIVETSPDPAARAARESLFAVGNGYLGLRGTPDEGGPAHDPGTIVNGL